MKPFELRPYGYYQNLFDAAFILAPETGSASYFNGFYWGYIFVPPEDAGRIAHEYEFTYIPGPDWQTGWADGAKKRTSLL